MGIPEIFSIKICLLILLKIIYYFNIIFIFITLPMNLIQNVSFLGYYESFDNSNSQIWVNQQHLHPASQLLIFVNLCISFYLEFCFYK